MENKNLVTYGIVFGLGLFALKSEHIFFQDTYTPLRYHEKDPLHVSLRKIQKASIAYTKIIKWRTSFLFSVVSTFIIYFFYHQRWPNTKETLLTIIILMSTFLIFWENVSTKIGSTTNQVVHDNIKQVKRTILTCK